MKLLPFDNKSELSVVIDLPEGSSLGVADAAPKVRRGSSTLTLCCEPKSSELFGA